MPFIPTFESCESEKHANQQDAPHQIWKVKGMRSHVPQCTTSVYTQHGSIIIWHHFALFSLCGTLPMGLMQILVVAREHQSSWVPVFKPTQPILTLPVLKKPRLQLSTVTNGKMTKIRARMHQRSLENLTEPRRVLYPEQPELSQACRYSQRKVWVLGTV